jgi:hypothetical protein
MSERYRIEKADFEHALQTLGPRSTLPKTQGVYLMANINTGRVYVGRSKNMHHRAGAHLSALRSNVPENLRMLADYQQHGEGSIRFAVIVEREDYEEMVWCERHAIAMALERDCYNKGGLRGCHTVPRRMGYTARDR